VPVLVTVYPDPEPVEELELEVLVLPFAIVRIVAVCWLIWCKLMEVRSVVECDAGGRRNQNLLYL
jgi:hypothetical protein